MRFGEKIEKNDTTFLFSTYFRLKKNKNLRKMKNALNHEIWREN